VRIASLQPSITVTLDRLGRLDTLCACTKYCLDVVPSLRGSSIQILHDSWQANTEEILAAKADLVIASVPYRMESLAAILKAGVPVIALAPRSLSDIYHDIHLIASVVNATEAGCALVREMQHAVEAAQMLTRSAPRPHVYCEEWGKPLIHSQGWVAELVHAAGGDFLGGPGSTTAAEAIADLDPDVLLFAWCGAGDRVPMQRVIEQRGWQHLRAVQQKNVYCIPDEFLNTPASTLLEGLACLGNAIHPSLFPAHARLLRLN